MEQFGRHAATAFKHDAAPGAALIAAAILALVFENTALAGLYDRLLTTPVSLRVDAFVIDKPLLLWINDGLMALFFFFVGLEIKNEVLTGQLSSLKRATLPAAAALGGVVVPALIFVAINRGVPANLDGWAIPAATDIAFAVGVLALLGTRAPTSLKIFLLALAIIDDLAAIVIIALFYTVDVSLTALGVAGLGLAGLFALNRFKVSGITPYVLFGLLMWAAVLKSGVHATLAGVLTALFIPLERFDDPSVSPLKRAEHGLKPWVYFLIMPAFAFANAGVPLAGVSPGDLLAPLPLGIALGLFVGKQIGVFGFAWAAVKSGLATLPEGLAWRQVYGAALLAGIGFTMSLFIGSLAFPDPETLNAVRIGVLAGSLAAGLAGYAVLRFTPAPRPSAAATAGA
jgi:NhaA family Na+:H+ antiporter